MIDTVITTPSDSNDSSAVGWAIAVVVLAVVLIAAFVWFQRAPAAPGTDTGTNINVTLPEGTGGTGGTGGTQY